MMVDVTECMQHPLLSMSRGGLLMYFWTSMDVGSSSSTDGAGQSSSLLTQLGSVMAAPAALCGPAVLSAQPASWGREFPQARWHLIVTSLSLCRQQ
jgi:hypothetical protein